ncbi:MAG: hypothetical protein LBC68_12030, partial [Prevotellaceae bacterium]|nr:hypothetical protein [Prevotellaceae bacterium]
MNAELKNIIDKKPEAFIYVSIPDNLVHEFAGCPRIINKRDSQIALLRHYASGIGDSAKEAKFEEYRNYIDQKFYEEFSMTQGDAIMLICNGEAHKVKGKHGVVQVSGIRGTYSIDQTTGAPAGTQAAVYNGNLEIDMSDGGCAA